MSKKNLKVFVDGEVLIAAHFSGIGHYTLELLRALDSLIETRDDVKIEIGVYYKRVDKIRTYRFRNFRIRRHLFPLRISNGLKIRGWQPPWDLFFGKRVYFFPNYTAWPLLFSKAVSVVYDLSFEFFPQYVEPRNQKFLSDQVKKTISWSDKIVTISTNSKNEISDFYKIPKKNIPIIYPGIDQSIFFRWPESEVAKIKAKYGIYGDYILFVGNIEPRKNLKNLLLAYEKLDATIRKDYSLLLVGARGWLDGEIFEIIERLRKAGDHIQQPSDYVIDEDRAAIFSGATLFVYPSLYEGFGIPPVEAMACGVPTITSNNSSLPEAVGTAARTVDAESVEQLSKAMEEVLKDKGLRERMVSEGYKQVDKFSWKKEAEKLLDVFMEVGE
ncbi:MAG TPA: glycosyltransferase family 1 protein [Candidatus Saccharibacteria bacterium]|jgi:glycosyltransferase involved in cell wall biosynthesis|nr:glycosyltransferase family 1 protein [Candidatus Saccharibacteria bacterium]